MVVAGAAEAERKDPIAETVSAFFRPYQHDRAALSPDGHHVAMSENLPGQPPAINDSIGRFCRPLASGRPGRSDRREPIEASLSESVK